MTERPDPARLERAEELMRAFAERTGVTGDRPSKRYLWTDAFAVCNYLGLARATGDESHRERALALIESVHSELGRHREDDPREGWLGDASAEHPTRGGLRIGKPLPERTPDEPFDQSLEWDRDGQYFHYLTKWMHALDLTTRVTGRPTHHRWARELAEAAHEGFVLEQAGRPRMVWKMSIDLSRPLVPSMGQHDPLDGLVTTAQLERTARALDEEPGLEEQRQDYLVMTRGSRLATDDPLGLGGLLIDAYRLEQLRRQGMDAIAIGDEDLLTELLEGARVGLEHHARHFDPAGPAGRRLAFRELGLAIGLHAVERMAEGPFAGEDAARAHLTALRRHVPLATTIETFWLRPESRDQRTWSEHRDINEVMLATSLAPEGCLVLPAVD